jgi:signal transduction histidine kinase
MAAKNFKSISNTSNGNHEDSQTTVLTSENIDCQQLPENHFKLKYKEIVAHNIELEKVVQKQKLEMDDIVATNNKFISILAHDLRSPFSAILGVLGLLTDNLKTYNSTQIERYIGIASNSANNTLRLLDNLLVWIISQHQGVNIKPIEINLNNLLLEEIENVTISANQKQITLQHCLAPDLVVTADEQMVKTIIRNLITNAIKYTEPFGVITVSAIEIHQYVEIAIEDNGIGVSFEAQKNLFKIDSFHSTIGTQNEKGVGLGLLICKDFVEMNGGTIWLESEQGKGSEFKFTLPHNL